MALYECIQRTFAAAKKAGHLMVYESHSLFIPITQDANVFT
jgi:hypothetical protein